jgi:hypothetical protein
MKASDIIPPPKQAHQSIPLRTPADLQALITEVSGKIHQKKSETMRLGLEIGLRWLKAHDYDPHHEIVNADLLATLKTLLDDALNRLSLETERLRNIHCLPLPVLLVADDAAHAQNTTPPPPPPPPSSP